MSSVRTEVRSHAATDSPASYVLPQPVRQPGELVLHPAGVRAPRHTEAEVARSIGERALALLECQQRFLGELREGLCECEAELGEATRARLQGRVRTALSILDWCDAVQSDLQQESRWTSHGLLPVDLTSFCREVVGIAAAEGVAVQQVGSRELPWWGRVDLLGEVVARGIDLARARAGGATGAVLEILPGAVAALRIAGIGEPVGHVEPELADAFRNAADRLGCRVGPDEFGPGGTGFVVELPNPSS